jgi:PPOX class probable F420-dependent enzyme
VTKALDVLGAADYVLLTTFRKDGTAVPTPVWVIRIGDELRIWSAPEAGKVKRIRRNGEVQLAPCSFRGQLRGASVNAIARVLPQSEMSALLHGLSRKYGVSAWFTTLSVRMGFRRGAVIGIRVQE